MRLISTKNKISTYNPDGNVLKEFWNGFFFIFTYEMFEYCLPFRSTWIHPRFSGIPVARSLVFWVVFCRSLFVFFPLAIELSVLPGFMAPEYPFGIFKIFLSFRDPFWYSYMSTEKMRFFYISDDIYVCKCMTFRIFIDAITCKLIRWVNLTLCSLIWKANLFIISYFKWDREFLRFEGASVDCAGCINWQPTRPSDET